MKDLLEKATLTRQTYGIAMAQGSYGRPTGIWLECSCCNESQVIVGSRSDDTWRSIPTYEVAKVFIRHGWTGKGESLKGAKCPKCSAEKKDIA